MSTEPISDLKMHSGSRVTDEQPEQLTAYRCGQKAVRSEGRLCVADQTRISEALALTRQGPSLFSGEVSGTSEKIGLASSCFSDILNYNISGDIDGFDGPKLLETNVNLTRNRSVSGSKSVIGVKPKIKTVNSNVTDCSTSVKQRHLLHVFDDLGSLTDDHCEDDSELVNASKNTRIEVENKGENLEENYNIKTKTDVVSERKLTYEEHKETDPLWKTKLVELNIKGEESIESEKKGGIEESTELEEVPRK